MKSTRTGDQVNMSNLWDFYSFIQRESKACEDLIKSLNIYMFSHISIIFSDLRLQLLDSDNSEDLIKSLYGLLMLLPQSEAFQLLRRRLNCIPDFHLASISQRYIIWASTWGFVTYHVYKATIKKSEYDQEIPQSHTSDQHSAPWGIVTEH